MFDQDHRVSEVPKPFQGFDQTIGVPWMKPDGWFIQNVHYPHQSGTDLRSKADPLGFSTGKGGCFLVQIEVIQSDIDQKIETGLNFPKSLFGHRELVGGQNPAFQFFLSFANVEIAELTDVPTLNGDCTVFGLKPFTIAFRTGWIADPIGMFPKTVTGWAGANMRIE